MLKINTRIFGDRPLFRVFKAAFNPTYYKALLGAFTAYSNPLENLKRYVFELGDYPYEVEVRTPIGKQKITLWTSHDIRTVNEIFCRKDYPARKDINTVVDIGSNIGISALYFLTRNTHVSCYLYEPNPENTDKLLANLAGFEARYTLQKVAVDIQNTQLTFAIEQTGRYGGLVIENIYRGNCTEETIVDCRDINDILSSILEKEQKIDILKIDTEGTELRIIKAIDQDLLSRIDSIYFEMNGQNFQSIKNTLLSDLTIKARYFHQNYGDAYWLRLRKL